MKHEIVDLKRLTKLGADLDRVMSERARHEGLLIKFRAEETALVEASNFDLETDLQKLADLRMRLELLPRRIEQFGEEAQRLEGSIRAELRILWEQVVPHLQSLFDVLRDKIYASVAPFLHRDGRAERFMNERLEDFPDLLLIRAYWTGVSSMYPQPDTSITANRVELLRYLDFIATMRSKILPTQVPQIPEADVAS